MADKSAPKNAKKFNCGKCDFHCSKQSEWNRHVMTLKHQNADKRLTNADKSAPKNAKNAKSFKCDCGNTYVHRQSLHKHQIKCSIHVGTGDTQLVGGLVEENSLTEKMIDLIMSNSTIEFLDKAIEVTRINDTIITKDKMIEYKLQITLILIEELLREEDGSKILLENTKFYPERLTIKLIKQTPPLIDKILPK